MAAAAPKPIFERRKPGGLKGQIRDQVAMTLEKTKRSFATSAPVLLVVDAVGGELLASLFTQAEISDYGFCLMEKLKLTRAPYPTFNAVYVMEPNARNIKRMAEDFNRPIPSADEATDDEEEEKDLIDKLWCCDRCCSCVLNTGTIPQPPPRYKECVLLALCGTVHTSRERILNQARRDTQGRKDFFTDAFKDVHALEMEFVVNEANLFSLEMPDCMRNLYEKPLKGGGQARDEQRRRIKQEAEDVGIRLATACLALNQLPVIRYNGDDDVARLVAHAAEAKLRHFHEIGWTPAGTGGSVAEVGRRAVLLIVGRTEDPVAPLLHSFGYQSSAMDLVPKLAPNVPYEYQLNKTKKQALLDDWDPVWTQLRHKHVVSAVAMLQAAVKQSLDSKRARRGGRSENDMEAVVNELLTEDSVVTAKINMHVSLSERLLALIDKHMIRELVQLEETIITGKDADGAKITVKKLKNLIEPMLREAVNADQASKEERNAPKAPFRKQDRARLLALVTLCHAADPDTFQPLIKQYVPKDLQGAVTTITSFGFEIKSLLKLVEQVHKAYKKREGGWRSLDSIEDNNLDQRVVCYTEAIAELLILGKLGDTYLESEGPSELAGSNVSFKDLGEGEEETKSSNTRGAAPAKGAKAVTTAAARTPAAGRSAMAAGNWGSDDSDEEEEQAHAAPQDSHKLIVFVVGGITYLESRQLLRLGSRHPEVPLDVIVGGTSILTPGDYLDQLSGIAASAAVADDDGGDDQNELDELDGLANDDDDD